MNKFLKKFTDKLTINNIPNDDRIEDLQSFLCNIYPEENCSIISIRNEGNAGIKHNFIMHLTAPFFIEYLADFAEIRENIIKIESNEFILRGENFIHKCPFHKEKTSSFTINIEKKSYHCLGCEAAGEIKFIFLKNTT